MLNTGSWAPTLDTGCSKLGWSQDSVFHHISGVILTRVTQWPPLETHFLKNSVHLRYSKCGPQVAASAIDGAGQKYRIQAPQPFWNRICLSTRSPGDVGTHSSLRCWMDHTKAICQPYISIRTSYHCFEALTKSYTSSFYWEIVCPPQFSNYLLQNMKNFYWDNFILPFAISSYKVAGSPGEECIVFTPNWIFLTVTFYISGQRSY